MTQNPREPASRHRRRRNRLLAAASLVVAVGVTATVLEHGAGRTPTNRTVTGASPAARGHAETSTTAIATDPGALPQAATLPVAVDAANQDRARALFDAIVADNPDAAIATFFPRAAYEQVKALKNPGADYDNRLLAQFRTDIHTLHKHVVATGRPTPVFAHLDVPDTAVWVAPRTESNTGSYWRVYDAQLRYTVDGVPESVPIKSLISWRGQWYVVHLVAIE